jgi:hypothetical protein
MNSYLLWEAFSAVMTLSVVESEGVTQAKPKIRKRPSTQMGTFTTRAGVGPPGEDKGAGVKYPFLPPG